MKLALMGLCDRSSVRRELRPIKMLSGRMVSLLLERERDMSLSLLENMVESRCWIWLKERLRYLSVSETSVKALLGIT